MALVTLVPGGPPSTDVTESLTLCTFCGSNGLADAILNLLLFLPFGWVVGWGFGPWADRIGRELPSDGTPANGTGVSTPGGLEPRDWWRAARRALIWGATISLGIEAAQLFLPGRYSSLSDLLTNALGAGLGGMAGSRRRLPVRTAAVACTVAVFAPALLLAPSAPNGTYWGQWTPDFGNMEHYEGQVLEANVGEVPLPSSRSDRTEEIRRGLLQGVPVGLLVIAGPPPSGEAPIFSIFDDREEEAFMVGAEGDDIFVWIRRLGTDLRLEAPTWWWTGAFHNVTPGDTIRIQYALGERSPCLTVQGNTRCLQASADFGGWSLLAPKGGDSPELRLFGVLWALSMGIPFGMLPLGFREKLLLAGSLGVGAVVVSEALPYWLTPWWGILAMLTGTITASLMEPWIREKLER